VGVVSPEIPLGIINLGSGGDYSRSVRVETPEYREALRTNRFALVDHGVMARSGSTPRLFLNIASVGMAGAMLAQRERSRFQAGAVAYFYHTVTSLLCFDPPEVTARIEPSDGETYEDRLSLINAFACKGCYSGGGMMWAPGADLQSGALDLTIVTGPRKWPLIQHCGKVYAGKLDEFPGTRLVRVRSVIIRSARPLHVEGDGERWIHESSGASEIEFSVRQAAFPLVR
jgi:diacylglycerol kinase family enzyme